MNRGRPRAASRARRRATPGPRRPLTTLRDTAQAAAARGARATASPAVDFGGARDERANARFARAAPSQA